MVTTVCERAPSGKKEDTFVRRPKLIERIEIIGSGPDRHALVLTPDGVLYKYTFRPEGGIASKEFYVG